MNKDHEKPESQGASGSQRRRLVGIFIILIAITAVSWALWLRSQLPLPQGLISEAGFTVFYPTRLDPGFSYLKGSGLDDNGLLIYKLTGPSGVITVTQQATPAAPPDLNHLKGYTLEQVPAGNAAYGESNNQPAIILLNSTTLLTAIGSRNMPAGVLHDLATNLTAVH